MMNNESLKIWEKHKHLVELLSSINNSCVLVAEICVGYWFLSNNFEFLGYDPEIIESSNIASGYIETRIHPDDRLALEAIQNQLFKIIESLPISKRKDYKHIYECRIKNIEDNYIRCIVQQQILELDAEGNPWLILGVIDISPDVSPIDHIKLCIINYKTRESIVLSNIETKDGIKLSKREKEILKMVRQGMLSKEISDQLFLSIHTVNKHRQNIMQKMNTNNLLEAIERARLLGLLD